MSNIRYCKTAAVLFAALNSVLTATASATDITSGESIAQTCHKLGSPTPPAEDLPASAKILPPAECVAVKLYDEARDSYRVSATLMKQARYCAYEQKDYEILAMIYANGYGVSRNLDLAIKFACQAVNPSESALSDEDFIVQRLLDIQDGTAARREEEACPPDMDKCTPVIHQTEEIFDICDVVGMPYAIGWCTGRTEAGAERKRNRMLDAIAQSMTPAQASAFKNLRQAATIFAEDRESEVNTMGSGRATWMTMAIAAQLDIFFTDITNCEHGDLPKTSTESDNAADKALNKTYATVMRAKSNDNFLDSIGESNITKSNVRKTERDWIRYRDAWLAFARLRYPQVPDRAWRTMLSNERGTQLKSILEEGSL